eukprot:31476-Pelagococcus_subviridis.AAC.21
MFFERMYTTHISIPSTVRGRSLSMLKCAAANRNDDKTIATSMRKYRVSDGIRNPRNIISSHTGATRDTTPM